MNAAPRLLDRVDPDVLGDIDSRCLAIDRLLLQVGDALDVVLVRAAGHLDRDARNQLVAARRAVDDLVFETGDLGLSLLTLRDQLNGEGRP